MKDKLELKKLWLRAHVEYQQRLRVKEVKQLVDYVMRRFLFAVAVTLAMFFIFRIV